MFLYITSFLIISLKIYLPQSIPFFYIVSNFHVATLDILNSKSKHLSLLLCDFS